MLERPRETETMKLYHDDAFIFENGHFFASRVGKDAHYTGNGDLSLVRGGQNIWETNFVPDLASIELTTWHERGAGATNLMFILADGNMHAHVKRQPFALSGRHRRQQRALSSYGS
jgi:hypothetical protein